MYMKCPPLLDYLFEYSTDLHQLATRRSQINFFLCACEPGSSCSCRIVSQKSHKQYPVHYSKMFIKTSVKN